MSTRKEKVAEAETKRKTPGEWFGKTIEEVKPIDKVEEMKPTDKAVAKNPVTTIKTPTIPTLSDMLATQRAEQRKAIEKDKTDAVKMQKYYALTDALGALGKMGGTAIGGAIGGGALDSAPVVAEYQPSRGYLNAFEKARQANDRLRALDEKEFNLAFNKQQRDEERAYQRKVMQNEREYKAKEKALDKQYQKEMIEYKAQLEQAIAQNNMELKAKLEAAIASKQHEYNVALTSLKGQYALDEKQLGLETSKWQAETYNTTPIKLSNGKIVAVPNNYYNSIKNSLINNKDITDKNVEQHIRANADKLLSEWGLLGETTASATTSTSPAQAAANSQFIEAQHTEPSESKKKEDNSGKVDLSQFERK